MSLESWKREFYGTPASPPSEHVAVAIQHSLTKWIGLRKENLERHGLKKFGVVITADEAIGPEFSINGGTCALCVKYVSTNNHEGDCGDCPLKELLGEPCDVEQEDGNPGPYDHWSETGDPEPMIKALEETLEVFG